jgi:hypothetical protein
LFTALTDRRVKTAASVGVNKEFSCVRISHHNLSPMSHLQNRAVGVNFRVIL